VHQLELAQGQELELKEYAMYVFKEINENKMRCRFVPTNSHGWYKVILTWQEVQNSDTRTNDTVFVMTQSDVVGGGYSFMRPNFHFLLSK
jgi:hypothetical protein